MSQKKAIVVGAGISGLTAAYRLQKAGFAVTVLEATENIGGRAHTVKKAGYTIDTGASTIAQSYVVYRELAAELGLAADILPASPYIGIIRDRQIHYLNVSNVYASGFSTKLFSWGSKLRLAFAFFDLFAAKQRGQLTYTDLGRAAPLDVETAREYADRRLNAELADYFVEPIVRSLQLANSDRVSKVELLSGLANIFDVKLYGMQGGVNKFSQALANNLNVKLQSPVTSVRNLGSGVEIRWSENGQLVTETADACVMACPLPAAVDICRDHQALQVLNTILRYGQCITVAIGTRIPPLNKAYLLQVPRKESEAVCFMFNETNKVKGVAPEGHGLICASLEEATAARMMCASDEQIVELVLPFIEQVMPEIKGSVDMTHVTRWPVALMLNEVGSFKAVAEFNAALAADAPIQFACDYMMSAVGQSIAVECGNRAAKNLITTLKTHNDRSNHAG